MEEESVIAGIYIGFSQLRISYSLNKDVMNYKSVLGENSYPILHWKKEKYGQGAMDMLFSEPNYLASNLLYLLSLKGCSNDYLNAAYFTTPSDLQSMKDGIYVTGAGKRVEDMLFRLFYHIKAVINEFIKPKKISISLPFVLKDTPGWTSLCDILDTVFDKQYRVKDCVTTFMLCKSLSQFKSGDSYACVLVVDEHYSYCTRVHVYHDSHNGNGDDSASSLNESNILHISSPQFIQKKVTTLICLIRNKLIETELKEVLHREGITLSRGNHDYNTFCKQLYTYIAYNLFSWKTSHDYKHFPITINGHKYSISAEQMKDACEDWIQTFVNSVIKHLVLDCEKNYKPEESLYITGDYGCLFSEQRVSSFKKQCESRGVGLYLPEKDDSSFAKGAIRLTNDLCYNSRTSSVLFSMTS